MIRRGCHRLEGPDVGVSPSARTGNYDSWKTHGYPCLAGCTEPISYSYDALSRTTTRTQLGVSTELSYRGTTEDLVATTSGQDRLLIAQGPYGPLAQGVVGQASFYLKDLHSDVVGLYGATSGTRAFDPWGEPMRSTGAAADAPLGFQSDWTDPSTGQVDMGTRFYEPTMGRFATQDVLFGEAANPNSLNQYVYGADSPVTMSDPTGMLSCVICNRPPHPDPDPCHATDTCAGGSGTTDGVGAEGETTATNQPSPITPDMPDYFHNLSAEQLLAVQLMWYRASTAMALGDGDYIEARDDRIALVGGSVLGMDDAVDCAKGSASGCFWTVVTFVPVGKLSRAAKAADLVEGIRDGEKAMALVKAADESRDVLKGITVMGHSPQFVQKATEIGARYFKIPEEYWSWTANMKFLDRTAKKGDVVMLTTPYTEILREVNWAKSTLRDEVFYMTRQLHYTPSADGMYLLPPGM